MHTIGPVMQDPFVHEWHNQTFLHPLGALLITICGLLTLTVSRAKAVLPFLIIVCFVAPAQRITVLGFDFTLLRILVLFGWLRVGLRCEYRDFRFKLVDACLLSWTLWSTIAHTLLYGTMDALVFKLGTSFDAIGMYFLFRILVQDESDLDHLIRGILWLSIPVACAFLLEMLTGRNLFSIFGAVPPFTELRQGALRCQGAYAHPILAGCFWAALIPLMASRWWTHPRERVLAATGCLNGLLVIAACASTTPVLALSAGLLATCCYVLRRHMWLLRWGSVFCVIGLHLYMKAPVWHLIARADLIAGSTGYHRFLLIDRAIRSFDEWWLLGTTSTAHWGYHLYDVTNQYVLEAVRGGLASLVLFIVLLYASFRCAGRVVSRSNDVARRIQGWLLGVCLFVHAVNFVAVSYFGQIELIWYLALATVASITPASLGSPVVSWRRAGSFHAPT